ncbi:hypothetical protein ACIA8G_19095 [Lentzea sp. NPDC051213]|uniref:hypothetical protein n=1 Tax=Lentzea sp. NPDC051213 TaxID=3364126 RepID=UPI003788E77D
MNITPEVPQLDSMRVQVRKHALMNEISKPARRWWRIAVPATGLTAAIAVAALLWAPANPSAFASWSAEPRAPGAESFAAADKCRETFDNMTTPEQDKAARESGIPVKPRPTNAALVDQRGTITLVVLTDPESVGYCLFTGSYWMIGMGGPEGDSRFLATRTGRGADDKDPARVLLGHVDPEVRGVRVDTADGKQVTATIDRGWVAAWWPSYAEATQVTLYDVNGNTLRTVAPENR